MNDRQVEKETSGDRQIERHTEREGARAREIAGQARREKEGRGGTQSGAFVLRAPRRRVRERQKGGAG